MADRKIKADISLHTKRDSNTKTTNVRQTSKLKSLSSMPLNTSKNDVFKPVSSCPLVPSKVLGKNGNKASAAEKSQKSIEETQDEIKKMKARIFEVEKVTLEYKSLITSLEKELESTLEDISDLDALKATEEAIEKASTDHTDYLERKEILQELLLSKVDLEKEILKDEERLAKVMQNFNEARAIQLNISTNSILKREAMPISETRKPDELKCELKPSEIDCKLQDEIYMAETELQALIEENETLHTLLKSDPLAV